MGAPKINIQRSSDTAAGSPARLGHAAHAPLAARLHSDSPACFNHALFLRMCAAAKRQQALTPAVFHRPQLIHRGLDQVLVVRHHEHAPLKQS